LNRRLAGEFPPTRLGRRVGSIKTAQLLLARGADVNGANKNGTTPLHVAAYHEQSAVAALLIRNGANVNARTEIGWTPLFKAMERLALAPATEKPSEAEVAKVAGIMELLLASGAQVDVQASVYGSPIHMAALTGQKTLVKMLVDKLHPGPIHTEVNTRSRCARSHICAASAPVAGSGALPGSFSTELAATPGTHRVRASG
jgi:ankyrin repeat protein